MKAPLLLILLFITAGISAQQYLLQPSIIAPAGDQNWSPDLMLDWTVGEVAIESLHAGDRLFTEGFHQSDLQVVRILPEPVVQPESISGEPVGVQVYPNPVSHFLTIQIHNARQQQYQVSVFDLNGRQLMARNMYPYSGSAEIDFSAFVQGMYLLRIINTDTGQQSSYRIAKL